VRVFLWEIQMSDAIGRAVIETVVDAAPMKAGIEEAKRSVRSLGAELGDSVADGSVKATRSIDAYIKKLESSAATVGMTARETKLLELTQRGATSAQLQAADAALRTMEAYKSQQSEARRAAAAAQTAAAITSAQQASQSNSAKLTAHQMQQLSFQLNDLFVQITSGQSPLTALIQQGSQLNGTFGGIGGTLRALGSLFTTTRVIIGGVGSVVAGFGYALMEGGKQSSELAKALALTGNAAGVTEGKFNSMALSIAEGTRSSIGSARETLQGLVASGQFTGNALSETAKATQLLAKATGQSTGDIVKQFVGMADGVGRWAETTNKSYHFLTAEQLDYIKTLEDQADAQKAIEVTMQALVTRIEGATRKTNEFGNAWSYVKEEAGKALDKLFSIGRNTTVDDQIAQLQQKIEFTNKSAGGLTGMSATALAAFNRGAEAQLAALKATKAAQDDLATGQAKTAAQESARIAFDKLKEQSLPRQQKLVKELADANAVADKAGISAVDREKVLASIREKYKEPAKPKGQDLRKPELDLDLEGIKSALSSMTSSYKNAETLLEAERSAGLVSERDYYAEKRNLIDLNAMAQVRALEQENQMRQAAKVSAKDAIDNQKKIVENRAKIAEIMGEADTKTTVSSISQKSAMDQVTRSYEEARIAAQEYLDTLSRQINQEVGSFDRGDKERNRVAARQQIEDRYNQQRLELENNKRLLEMEGKFSPDARVKYDKQLAILQEYQAKALATWDAGYKAIGMLESDWSTGARRAMENYFDSAANVSRQTEGLFSNAFQSMEDAIVQFSMTGKLSFSDMAKSIIFDIIRIQARQQIAGLASSAMGSLTGMFDTSTRSAEMSRITAQASAAGGYDIPAGVNPVVQTHAREMILPEQYADVIRNMASGGGGGGGGGFKVNIYNGASNTTQAEARPSADGSGLEIFINAIKNSIGEDIAYGTGPVNAAFQGRYGLRPAV
jgi:lambda family phage tail tape measure protein